ncbi:MAG: HAMP domain-containing histidine kinase [Mogibacterium sp.]|nr:HAMP domain-containing histidine kinase [Mogibacterium sp.]
MERATRKGSAASGLSITAKITIWYTLFLMIVAAVLSFVLFRLYDEKIQSAAENKLVRVVDEVGDLITDDGDDFILDRRISYYHKDTYISVYEMDEELVTGRRPRGIDVFPPLSSEEIQVTRDSQGSEWYIYDNIINVEGKDMYIRGMLNNIADDDKFSFTISLAAALIPIILIIAAIGGYAITRGAFAPVRETIKATKEITRDGDLSRRIPQGKSRDEIYELSTAFNDMFDRVEELVKREKQFTADVSHELRTPLAIIRAQSEYAMEDDSYAPDAVGVINRESRRMSSLIGNLLMIARSDSGRMVPDNKELNVSELLEGLAEIKRSNAEDKGLSLETDIEDGINMETDEDMLARIVVNLLDNAIKYDNKEGGQVRLSARTDESKLTIRVSDDGEGIRPEDREKIWERFYRSDAARTHEESSGIGLSIVKVLSKALGGNAELRSDEESELGGATFEVTLPYASKAEENTQ